MLYYYGIIFLLFMIYSFLGYIIEVIEVSKIHKKLTLNRGFLIGPYLPIFGFGSLIMIYALNAYEDDILVLFVMSAVSCSILEYLTSLVLEKIFKLRWWNYSNKSFNLNGRICLQNSILFGIGGVLIVKIINPVITSFLYFLPELVVEIIAVILFIGIMIDFILTLYIMVKLKSNFNQYDKRDATYDLKKDISKLLKKNNYLTARLLKSFPELTDMKGQKFEEFKKNILKFQQERKRKRKRK